MSRTMTWADPAAKKPYLVNFGIISLKGTHLDESWDCFCRDNLFVKGSAKSSASIDSIVLALVKLNLASNEIWGIMVGRGSGSSPGVDVYEREIEVLWIFWLENVNVSILLWKNWGSAVSPMSCRIGLLHKLSAACLMSFRVATHRN